MVNLPLYLAGAAAVACPVSIAAYQILMGMTIVALIATRSEWRFPPVWIPLSLFMVGTVASLLASGHVRAGYPQIKKFYVYLMLFLVVSAVRTAKEARVIALAWALAAALSAAWGLVQFASKYRLAQAEHQDFYRAYVGRRITGFMDHWMTFSGEMMIALMIMGALVFFAIDRRWVLWLAPAAALASAGLVLAFSRIMWAGAAAGGIYLLWMWRKWTVLAVPLLAGILLLMNPFDVRERALSIFHPHGDMDSNAHRGVTQRVGWEMIKAHPWVGVGPQQVGLQFENYVPADIPRPLPTGYYGHLHNIYIQYAAERGIPTMLALMWFLGLVLFDFAQGLRRWPAAAEGRWILHAGIAATIAVMVGGLEEYNLNDSEVLGMFLALVGCGYAALYEGDKKCKA
jgi:putative inorganic carbon (HCO3(-)) transporter